MVQEQTYDSMMLQRPGLNSAAAAAYGHFGYYPHQLGPYQAPPPPPPPHDYQPYMTSHNDSGLCTSGESPSPSSSSWNQAQQMYTSTPNSRGAAVSLDDWSAAGGVGGAVTAGYNSTAPGLTAPMPPHSSPAAAAASSLASYKHMTAAAGFSHTPADYSFLHAAHGHIPHHPGVGIATQQSPSPPVLDAAATSMTGGGGGGGGGTNRQSREPYSWMKRPSYQASNSSGTQTNSMVVCFLPCISFLFLLVVCT